MAAASSSEPAKDSKEKPPADTKDPNPFGTLARFAKFGGTQEAAENICDYFVRFNDPDCALLPIRIIEMAMSGILDSEKARRNTADGLVKKSSGTVEEIHAALNRIVTIASYIVRFPTPVVCVSFPTNGAVTFVNQAAIKCYICKDTYGGDDVTSCSKCQMKTACVRCTENKIADGRKARRQADHRAKKGKGSLRGNAHTAQVCSDWVTYCAVQVTPYIVGGRHHCMQCDKNDAPLQCPDCMMVFYCNDKCRMLDWGTKEAPGLHRSECAAVKNQVAERLNERKKLVEARDGLTMEKKPLTPAPLAAKHTQSKEEEEKALAAAAAEKLAAFASQF